MENEIDAKALEEMKIRCKSSLRVSCKKYEGDKWVKDKRVLSEVELNRVAYTCIRNKLIPELGHVSIINENVYITWEGIKHITDLKNIFWKVNSVEFRTEDVQAYDENKNTWGTDTALCCDVEVSYLIPVEDDVKNPFDTYERFLIKMSKLGMKPDEVNGLIPSSYGYGMFPSKEVRGKVSKKTMAYKRALMMVFGYICGIEIPTDSSEAGDLVISNTPEKKKNSTKKTESEPVKEQIYESEEFNKMMLRILQIVYHTDSIHTLSEGDKNKVNRWKGHLWNFSDKQEDREKMAEKQIYLLSMLQKFSKNKDKEALQYANNLIKADGFSDLYDISHLQYVENFITKIEEKYKNVPSNKESTEDSK